MRGLRWALLLVYPILVACGEDGVGPPQGGSADSIPPEIVSVSPPDGAEGVPTGTAVRVTFSEPINLATAAVASFFVVGNGEQVPGDYVLEGSTVAFLPSAPLDPFTRYTATVTEALRDPTGNALVAGRTWSFATGAVIQPAPR